MMNQKEIFRKVGGILNELNEQYDYLSQNPENLNELELELFSANASFLSDHISILVKLGSVATSQGEAVRNDEAAAVATAAEPAPAFNFDFAETQEISRPEPTAHTASNPEIQTDSFIEDKVPESNFFETTSQEAEPVIETEEEAASLEESAPEEESAHEVPVEIQEEPLFVASGHADSSAGPEKEEVIPDDRSVITPEEKPEENSPRRTMNDILGQRPVSAPAPQFSPKPTGDLKTMISLNDKLLFVKDLFNGYSLAYSEAIELLNRFDSFEAAENFLIQNYAAKNRWADKQSTADRFYEVLNKRFSRF